MLIFLTFLSDYLCDSAFLLFCKLNCSVCSVQLNKLLVFALARTGLVSVFPSCLPTALQRYSYSQLKRELVVCSNKILISWQQISKDFCCCCHLVFCIFFFNQKLTLWERSLDVIFQEVLEVLQRLYLCSFLIFGTRN